MPTVSYNTAAGRFERRIGSRQETSPLEITWVFAISKPPTEWPGRIENASVTGASIFGPVDLPIGTGAKTQIRFEDDLTVVQVRRSELTDRPGVARYGVEFISRESALQSRLFRTLGEGRPQQEPSRHFNA